MAQKYAFVGYDEEKMARALGTGLPISTKVAVEICNHLRRKPLQRVKTILEAVVAMKEAIPYRRFNMDVGHKPGMAAGRYPVKACAAILALVKSAEANAQFKGLHSSNLHLVHICAHKAARPMRYGRQRGRQAKRTHVEVVLQEMVVKKKEAKQVSGKKPVQKAANLLYDKNAKRASSV